MLSVPFLVAYVLLTRNADVRCLQLDDLPLRPYSQADCIAFMRDLLDGFFPYELKHAYPEGLVFTLRELSR